MLADIKEEKMILKKGYTDTEYADFAVLANSKGMRLITKENGDVEMVEIIRPEPTYQELRRRAYPEISEQLDMLYWDKINGTNNWMTAITEIKNKYPKE